MLQMLLLQNENRISFCSLIGTTTNHKIGFMTNATTRGVFDTSGQFGIGTDAPGAF